MQTWAKRGIQTALVTGGLLMLGTGIAAADEDVNPDKPASPLDEIMVLPADLTGTIITVAPNDSAPPVGYPTESPPGGAAAAAGQARTLAAPPMWTAGTPCELAHDDMPAPDTGDAGTLSGNLLDLPGLLTGQPPMAAPTGFDDTGGSVAACGQNGIDSTLPLPLAGVPIYKVPFDILGEALSGGQAVGATEPNSDLGLADEGPGGLPITQAPRLSDCPFAPVQPAAWPTAMAPMTAPAVTSPPAAWPQTMPAAPAVSSSPAAWPQSMPVAPGVSSSAAGWPQAMPAAPAVTAPSERAAPAMTMLPRCPLTGAPLATSPVANSPVANSPVSMPSLAGPPVAVPTAPPVPAPVTARSTSAPVPGLPGLPGLPAVSRTVPALSGLDTGRLPCPASLLNGGLLNGGLLNGSSLDDTRSKLAGLFG